MRTRVRGRRRRPNPLRRRSDVIEAWTVLVTAVLLVLGAPLAGLVAGWWAHDVAREVAAQQRAERHRVRAEVIDGKPGSPGTAQAGRERFHRATVRWTEPGVGSRTASARVPSDARQGDAVGLWFDSRGRQVSPPADTAAVWQHTLGIGVCGAGGGAVVVLLGRSVVRGRALRHRMTEWERDWALVEPRWSRRRA